MSKKVLLGSIGIISSILFGSVRLPVSLADTSSIGYATYFGGTGHETGFAIAADNNGNTYVVGSTNSSEYTSLGGDDIFAAKFNSSGQLIWTKVIGGSADDTAFAIDVDISGNTYITGTTSSVNFPMKNAMQTKFGGGYRDAYILKLDTNGSVAYSTYFGGTGDDTGYGVAVDGLGRAYVTGSVNSSEISSMGGNDVYAIRMNASGNQKEYMSVFGGNGDETGYDIDVDISGNAYIVGFTDSSNFILTNPLQPYKGGDGDAFVTKLSPGGNTQVYSTYFGGTGYDAGYGIVVDGSGNAYITGSTASPDFASLGGSNVYVAKFNPTGSERVYFAVLGGSNDDIGFGIAIDSSGNAYVTGHTSSTNFTTANAVQPNLAGQQDAFVTKLNPIGTNAEYSTFLGGSGNDAGFGVAVDGIGNAYVAGFSSSSNFPVANSYQSTNRGQGEATIAKILASPAQPATAHTGLNVKLADGTVCLVSLANQLRCYTSGGAFTSYGFNSFYSLADANSVDLALSKGSFIPPQDGKVICSDRGPDKGTCYLITGGQKAGFTSSDVFTGLGYQFSRVGYGDLSWMASATLIDNVAAAHRIGSLIDKNGTVYLVAPQGLLGLPDTLIFFGWGYTFEEVVKANNADSSKVPVGNILARQQGQLLPY